MRSDDGRGSAPMVRVTGVSGGLGASTLTAALGPQLARRLRPVVLVDLDVGGGGLDVTCGLDHLGGLRWSDLHRVDGSVDPRRLIDALPGPPGCKVLSAGTRAQAPSTGSSPSGRAERDPLDAQAAPGGVPAGAVRDVLSSLLRGDRLLILDAHRAGPGSPDPTLEILLTGTRVRQLADLDAYVAQLEAGRPFATDPVADCVLVTCGDAPSPGLREALGEHTGIPVVGHIRRSRTVERASEKGEWPGSGIFAEIADELVRRLPEARSAA